MERSAKRRRSGKRPDPVSEAGNVKRPQHIAIIMDGNGRWAKNRLLPRQAGHRAGLTAVRRVIEGCVKHRIEALTLFAFSSENWQRPGREVGSLMRLFMHALETEVAALHRNNIRIRFVGAHEALSRVLNAGIRQSEQLTHDNTGLVLNIAVGYGGRWDIVQAVRRLTAAVASGQVLPADINEARLAQALSLFPLKDPDLFIRTGGEQRISNFLLWNLAYTELYFVDTLWPDFDEQALGEALRWFGTRKRRFGRAPQQLRDGAGA